MSFTLEPGKLVGYIGPNGAAAKEHGETVIYTEDIPGQPEIDGVRYVNPFAEPD